MTSVRYAPHGSTTEKTINQDLAKLLGDVREHTSPYEYSFDAVLDLPLHKGAVLYDKTFATQKTTQSSFHRTAKVVANPHHPNFLVPLSQKTLLLQWTNKGDLQV